MRALVACLFLLLASTADAANTCQWDVSGTIWSLLDDCTTDESIVVPPGITLDGHHHTLVALDPADGPFRGGIVTARGGTAHVENLTISTLLLADVCLAGDDRLRGIYFDGASGTIRGNTILNVNKGDSRCQEGNGIEVRRVARRGEPVSIEIEDNALASFQKSGIVVSGDVDARIRRNVVGSSATQTSLAANGLQIGDGARAIVEGNAIEGNSWSAPDAAATAILLMGAAPGTVIRRNVITGNSDVGIYLNADGVRVADNRLTDTGGDGFYDIGIGNYGERNEISGNAIAGFIVRMQGIGETDAGPGVIASR